MSTDEWIVFGVLAGALALFVRGPWRYDVVALLALLAVTLTGVVSARDAFSGFGHPAVITVAAVLVLSRGLQEAGVVDLIARPLSRLGDNPSVNVAALTGTVAILSGFMNNVGAMALIMPVAIRTARRGGFPPGLVLMPIAFGSLLGGMTTLIGTPPNVIVAGFRNGETGGPFRMFDFAPVGGAVAVAGVAFIALAGWRLVPRRQEAGEGEDLFGIEEFFSEVRVAEGSKADGMLIKDVGAASEAEIVVAGLVRPGGRIIVPSAFEPVHAGDVLIVKADSEDLTGLVERLGLELVGAPEQPEAPGRQLGLVEAVVLANSILAGRSARDVGLRARYGVNLLAVARPGSRPRGRLASTRLAPGDVLLLQGQPEDLPAVLRGLSCVPIGGVPAQAAKANRIPLALLIFAVALVATGTGLVQAQVALVAAAAAMLIVRLLRIDDAYNAIDWPVIILLGAMIPVGTALETSGGASRIVEGVDWIAGDLPPVVLITIVLVATMLLSDVVNNAAAAVLMAPIGIQLALNSGSSVDPFLMAVAIGASCAFLTPIGHQSNTLVLVPGGYKFGDYWRMGLPLEILIVLVAVPLLMLVWPP